MIAGITGTRLGADERQLAWLRASVVIHDVTELHHGDCVGVDAQAHQIAIDLGLKIVIHPPLNEAYRAFCGGDNVTVLPAKEYLERNRDIVDQCDVLFGLPDGPQRARSGTWYTIRHARNAGRKVEYLLPKL